MYQKHPDEYVHQTPLSCRVSTLKRLLF